MLGTYGSARNPYDGSNPKLHLRDSSAHFVSERHP
jgi:hypothetical protein